jgi:hypothetical protein
VAAGKDDALRAEAAHESVVDVPGMNLAVDPGFAHAPGDELRVLGAEIEDQDLLMLTRPGNSAPP